ncbi:hypothetical protein LSAT2_014306 [Lamellibrachia satsuma]|nr:hypothetical protein LSAT2_014306 [Lamellibrachia satsuma]
MQLARTLARQWPRSLVVRRALSAAEAWDNAESPSAGVMVSLKRHRRTPSLVLHPSPHANERARRGNAQIRESTEISTAVSGEFGAISPSRRKRRFMHLIGVKSNRWQMRLPMGLTVKQRPEAPTAIRGPRPRSRLSPRAAPSVSRRLQLTLAA